MWSKNDMDYYTEKAKEYISLINNKIHAHYDELMTVMLILVCIESIYFICISDADYISIAIVELLITGVITINDIKLYLIKIFKQKQ